MAAVKNPYRVCEEIERQGLAEMEPFILREWPNCKIVYTHGSPELNQYHGDLHLVPDINSPDTRITIEVKVEETFTRNVYLEKFSNVDTGRRSWLFNSKAQEIWFYFLDTKDLHMMDFPSLQKWALSEDPITGKYEFEKYPYARQRKRVQKNLTDGHLVGIKHLRTKVAWSCWWNIAQPLYLIAA